MFRADTPLGTGPDKAKKQESEDEVMELAVELEAVRKRFGDAIKHA